jgi:hypothetical protein
MVNPDRRCEVIYIFVYTSGPSLCRTGELLYDPLRHPDGFVARVCRPLDVCQT